MSKTVAYLRVSTADQDLEKNRSDIIKFVNQRDFGGIEFVEEKASGKIPWKDRKIRDLLLNLEPKDRLIVPELSRLGRSMLEIMEILAIAQQGDIHIYSVKGEWELNSSIQSKVMAMAFAIAAEIERDLISKRTKEALRACKAKGIKLGRPKGPGKSKLDPFREEIVALLNNGSTKKHVAMKYDTSRVNLNNWLKKNEIVINPLL